MHSWEKEHLRKCRKYAAHTQTDLRGLSRGQINEKSQENPEVSTENNHLCCICPLRLAIDEVLNDFFFTSFMVEKLLRLWISCLNSYSLKACFKLAHKRVVSMASPHLELNVGSKIVDSQKLH